MAEIEIVQAVEGATHVMFDYAAASTAIDTYSAMAQRLSAQLDPRASARDAVIVNWSGRYEGEFDGAWTLLQMRLSGGVEAVGYGMQAVYNAIDDANEMQRTFNRNAEEARTHPAVPAGPTGPHGAY
jgi:uncharacterized protein YukE